VRRPDLYVIDRTLHSRTRPIEVRAALVAKRAPILAVITYGIFTLSRRSIPMLAAETPMDMWFIGLIVVLTLLTWGGVVLCARLLRQP
jgi:hypothetical protein